jgi:hypothetical protein
MANHDIRPVLKIEVLSALQMGFGTSKNTSRKTTLQNIILMSKCSHHLKSWINRLLQQLFIISSSCLTPAVQLTLGSKSQIQMGINSKLENSNSRMIQLPSSGGLNFEASDQLDQLTF